jgi:hypothetical protein
MADADFTKLSDSAAILHQGFMGAGILSAFPKRAICHASERSRSPGKRLSLPRIVGGSRMLTQGRPGHEFHLVAERGISVAKEDIPAGA